MNHTKLASWEIRMREKKREREIIAKNPTEQMNWTHLKENINSQ